MTITEIHDNLKAGKQTPLETCKELFKLKYVMDKKDRGSFDKILRKTLQDKQYDYLIEQVAPIIVIANNWYEDSKRFTPEQLADGKALNEFITNWTSR